MAATRSRWTGLIYLAPALAFVGLFVMWPLGHLVWLSLTSDSLLGGGKFVGLANYTKALHDRTFQRAFTFTLVYTLYLTPVLMGLGFALALLVSGNTPLRKLTRTIVFLPVVIGLASSSQLWIWLFNEQVGLFNKLLVDLHILSEPLVWFRRADTGQLAVSISVIWKVVGFGMILMVAGLQSISQDVVEASMIDGASAWQRARKIMFPLALPSIVLATLISVVGSMLAFDQFYLMTQGGPRGHTFTAVYWIYQASFVRFELGYGAALSVILMVVIVGLTALQLFLARRGVKT